jgi:hypothetical protein
MLGNVQPYCSSTVTFLDGEHFGVVERIEDEHFVVRSDHAMHCLPVSCIFTATPWETVLICTHAGLRRYSEDVQLARA